MPPGSCVVVGPCIEHLVDVLLEVSGGDQWPSSPWHRPQRQHPIVVPALVLARALADQHLLVVHGQAFPVLTVVGRLVAEQGDIGVAQALSVSILCR